MAHDGCLGSPVYTECSTKFNGVFGKGLHGVLQLYANSLLEVVLSLTSGIASTSLGATAQVGTL